MIDILTRSPDMEKTTLTTEEARLRRNERRRSDPEQVKKSREAAKRWKENNPERHKELKRQSYQRNKERINAAARADSLTPERLEERRSKAREYYRSNRERIIAADKARKQENLEKVAQYRRKYREDRRAEHVLYDVKKRTKKAGVECTLTVEWIRERFESGKCELTGVAFDMDGKRTPNAPSIDRVDPAGGYTPENCEMILWSLNRAFCNYGREYLIDLFRKIAERDV